MSATSAFAQVEEVLRNDGILLTYLAGGLYSGVKVNDITRQSNPEAFDEFAELKPIAILREESLARVAPYVDTARYFLNIWFYQQFGTAEISLARDRVFFLLNNKVLNDAWTVDHINDLLGLEIPDVSLGAIMSRYQVMVKRG